MIAWADEREEWGWPEEPNERHMRGWRLVGFWALVIGASFALLTAVVYFSIKVAEAL